MRPSVLGEPLVVHLQEPTPVEKRLEYAIQATASVWEPLEQVHCVVSGDVDFDSPVGCTAVVAVFVRRSRL